MAFSALPYLLSRVKGVKGNKNEAISVKCLLIQTFAYVSIGLVPIFPVLVFQQTEFLVGRSHSTGR